MAASKSSSRTAGKPARLMSLDVFRGATVAFMIIVNTPGTWSHVYAPLRHAQWHGCTPTDLVFPSFLFISGVAMWYSLRKFNFGFSGASLFRILRRVLLIFAAGLFLNIFPHFIDRDYNTLRIMGVLQRIALAWGLGATLVLLIKRNYIWLATAVILFGYWALMYFLGGADPYSLEGNFARTVDIAVLGENHLYKGFGMPFDPEGLLSTLPATATVLLGFMAGGLISGSGTSWKTPGWLTLTGALLIGAGLLWGHYFPINKPIWTSSYVLYAGGIGMIILALLYVIIDIWNLRGWTGFFNTFGTNALFTYLLAGIWTKTMLAIKIGEGTLYKWIFTNICSPLFEEQKLASLLFAVIQVMIVWAFGYILYRKKIIIKF
ncbi:MAG: acyltransferase family protein [Actinomycetota bacterium]|jgi:predicted acyltransferase